MVQDAYKFLIPLLVAAALFAVGGIPLGASALVLLAGYVGFFFRNPRREIPSGENLVVSPADGKVVKVGPLSDEEGERGGHRVSIFLSIFDVHVNRAPISGRLERIEYKRGRFKAAFDEEASRVNEQNVLTIQGDGIRIVVKQIAGLIARRVVCWKRPGHAMERGELFGLIRFGSRVDMLLPSDIKVLVKPGDRVKGGSSIIGERI